MKGPKTLYVSDLDGTLLRRDQTVSPFTAETINTLTARGMLFSYATARSLVTAKTVTKGLNTHFPLIIYNGAFVRDNVTEEILLANYFDASVYAVLDELFKANIYPIVYANVDGREHFSFIYEKCTPGLKDFADTRVNDPRTREVYTTEELTRGDLFYITCIGDPQKLAPFYEKIPRNLPRRLLQRHLLRRAVARDHAENRLQSERRPRAEREARLRKARRLRRRQKRP